MISCTIEMSSIILHPLEHGRLLFGICVGTRSCLGFYQLSPILLNMADFFLAYVLAPGVASDFISFPHTVDIVRKERIHRMKSAWTFHAPLATVAFQPQL